MSAYLVPEFRDITDATDLQDRVDDVKDLLLSFRIGTRVSPRAVDALIRESLRRLNTPARRRT